MNHEDAVSWLWVIKALGVGNKRIWEVLADFDSNIQEAAYAIQNGHYSGLNNHERDRAKLVKSQEIDEICEKCDSKGWRMVSFNDPLYPEGLRRIFNPPGLLFSMGNPYIAEDEAALTVVGTRDPSPYGISIAQWLCGELARAGIIINSGFALGMDSQAHKASLKALNRTIAVLACGLDVDYPVENAPIKNVIARCGAVVTEMFPGTRYSGGYTFHMRNRILAGIGVATLVIEAPAKSGSLITANLAMQQGKEVFCIPPGDLRKPMVDAFAGNVQLLRDGASAVYSPGDIIEFFANFKRTQPLKVNSVARAEKTVSSVPAASKPVEKKPAASKDRSKEKLPKPVADTPKAESKEGALAKAMALTDNLELSELQRKIINCISEASEISADELSNICDVGVGELLSKLTELEFYGIISCGPGQRYSLC